MPSEFVWNKETVRSELCNDNLCIEVREEQYRVLTERMYNDIKDLGVSELYDVFRNRSVNYEPFIKIFINLIKEKSLNEIKLV